ncbi:vacuolar import and degradation domain-containing protein [Trichoderma camerunense]|uniref:Vacuolar import and degradation protein domain-containing protein n=2 Tax=Trichoderma TaxID=5543 RepID=A0A9W9B9F7_9HYPO|nr:vacuolar import and degradation protein domain-containing protein [Trichoderma breve]KAJ4855838.1 vacuolar import and degradation protein domain-containing protein [Trichoderma breve]QYT05298.1 Vacuolar import and degradation protein, vid24,involved in vacuolar targeting [Trichoderma simmonsii]
MPTPSSNPPPEQTSPPPYNFPTCPEDQPHSSRSPRPAQDATRPASDMESSQSSATSIASPTAYSSESSRDGPATEYSVLIEGQASAGASPMDTTSPRPPSSGTVATSPMSSGRDDDLKNQGAAATDRLSRESSTLSAHLQVENPGSFRREPDSLERLEEEDEYDSPPMPSDCTNLRKIPISPSSFLRPGSKFRGTQQSERQVYEVQVEIKHVDLRESFLCGYLRIQGLTEDHPTLTTYFEGEIIGTKYNFFTKHDDWGANSKVDLSHWSKFSAFRPYQKMARKGPVTITDLAQRDHIFMRWKEHFLVPDHRVRTITGASFEGFYYICFNQVKGEISGIYFHSKSEKFQQLELKHVPDRGCFSAMEFR